MVSTDPAWAGTPVPWDGSSPATAAIAALVGTAVPEGTLRVVIQRLRLREDGEDRGLLRVADAITDVDGNLVVVPLSEYVHGASEVGRRLREAVDRLQEDVAASGAGGADSFELVLDADGARQVLLTSGLEVTPSEAAAFPPHPAVHGGAHHIAYESPALDDLRDRMRPPEPPLLARGWARLRGGE